MQIATSNARDEASEGTYHHRIRAWAFYSWALDGVITTNIITFFPPYFIAIATPAFLAAGKAATDKAATALAADTASNVFSLVIALTLFVAAIIAPIIGTYADITGRRKRILVFVTALGSVFASMMLALTTGAWLLGLILYSATQLAINIALGMNSSLLPHVSRPDDLNRVSSLGYAMSFIGGGILLAANVGLYAFADQLGIGADTAVRIAFFSTGAWWMLFTLPLALGLPEPPGAQSNRPGNRRPFRETLTQLRSTLRDLKHYRELLKMLIAFWLYSEGISAIILLATAYGASLGLDAMALVGAILVTELVGFPYVLIFGRIPDATGKWRGAYASMIVWTAITMPMLGMYANRRGDLDIPTTLALIFAEQLLGIAFSALIGRRLLARFAMSLDTKRSVLLGLAIFLIIPVWAFFLKTSAEFFMVGWLVGTAQGGVQALSRTIYANMTPRAKSGEFFGLYGLCERFAGILAPLLYGIVGLITHSPQVSLFSVAVFFAAGMYALWHVNERSGSEVAAEEDTHAAAQRA